MDKKEIQRRRKMIYFIEAAAQIIEEEGLEAVTIRKVADLAGYNSATLYNYFENLDHLKLYAALRFLKPYVEDLPHCLAGACDALDRYLRIWRCFCRHSFEQPHIYNAIFFANTRASVGKLLEEYFSLYPQELEEQPPEVLPMLLERNICARGKASMRAVVEEGFIAPEDVEDVNEMTMLIYQAMLSRVLNRDIDYSIEEAVERTLRYITKVAKSHSVR